MRRSEALQDVRLIKFRSVLGRYQSSDLNQMEATELLGIRKRSSRRFAIHNLGFACIRFSALRLCTTACRSR